MIKNIVFSKKFMIVFSIVTIITVACSVYALFINPDIVSGINNEDVYIAEPENNDAPDKAKWVPELGCYVHEDYYYDKGTKTIKETEAFKGELKELKGDYKERESYRRDEWKEKNKYTDNKLFRAILNWEKDQKIGFSCIYIIEDDPAFTENIVSLGIDYIPQMLDLLYKDKVWCWQMSAAIESITGVRCLPEDWLMDDAEFKHDLWRETFKEYMTNAEEMVKSEKDIEKLGVFALPYISKEVKADNKEYASYIPLAISKVRTEQKVDLTEQSTEYWCEWLDKNEEKINKLKDIIDSFNR